MDSWPTLSVTSLKRADLVHLRAGVDISLQYFNNSDRTVVRQLTRKAKKWSQTYFKGYHYAAKRPTGLLKIFPHLFNLDIEAHSRLTPAPMEPSGTSEPEGVSPHGLRQAERKTTNSEAFPEFTEPTLASPSQLDEIVNLRPRQPLNKDGKVKPNMRVDAAMLRDSGLLSTLPEFLGQLARANLETETLLANDPDAARFELNEEDADEQPHIEMDIYAGVVESQKRRHARRILLPGGRPFDELYSKDLENNDIDAEDNGSDNDNDADQSSASGDESGDDSDASSSTIASLRVKKRKALDDPDSDEEDSQPPNKLRIQYHYPAPTVEAFDMKRRQLVRRPNPDAGPEAQNYYDIDRPQDDAKSTPTPSARNSSDSDSSVGPTRIIKIKLNTSKSNSPSSNNNTSCSGPDSSRKSTPEPKQKPRASESPSTRIIRLKDPRSSPSASSSSSSEKKSSAIKLKLNINKKISPLAAAAHSGSTSSSNAVAYSGSSAGSLTSSSGFESSVPAPVAKKSPVRIKVVRRASPDQQPQ
ncbi:hypothetical protein B0T17DRAFT_510527 [Bombardia bombarda]|uniref:Uncharacterized protein n=1 Tax=Bombardia bombarda TaxID=252184 RepID=A0AA39WIG0_9PEZI|nr:hypothetical protein B0T17DRAFT_510527 [Bombardia bombarda]